MTMEKKIIFTGPVGAGKTTAIASISDIPVVSTDVNATDDVAKYKPHTTVAMDYGILNLDEGAKVHLYGTPGQERFSFMWDILTTGGIGLVLMLNNNRQDPLSDLQFFVDSFKSFIKSNGVVIGVSHMDMSPKPTLKTYHKKLDELNLKAPIFEVDARNGHDIRTLLLALLSVLDPSLKR